MKEAIDVNQGITGQKGVTIKNYKTSPRLSKIFSSLLVDPSDL